MSEHPRRLIRYDAELRRVWIGGQRLHHGVTGMFLASAGLGALAARFLTARRGVGVALAGGALMAHDWKDRTEWFARSAQEPILRPSETPPG